MYISMRRNRNVWVLEWPEPFHRRKSLSLDFEDMQQMDVPDHLRQIHEWLLVLGLVYRHPQLSDVWVSQHTSILSL